MFQVAQNGSCAYKHRDQNFPLIFAGQYIQSESAVLSLLFKLTKLTKVNNNWVRQKSGTYSLHAILKIILGLHILLSRPEIRPRIALRLRANLVLLGRRRWKRFLEYWEGKTLENYFCEGWVPWFVKNSPSQGLWSSWLCPNAFYAWNVFSSLTNYSKREKVKETPWIRSGRPFFCTNPVILLLDTFLCKT